MGQRGGDRVMRFAAVLTLAAGAADAACPPREMVELETATGVVAFGVEIAETPDERARGLMFRTEMARDRGMLFLFSDAAPRTFWMKDTPLSLDMLFMSPDGVVCGIVREATPLSLDPRPSGCDASVVLEINGGLSDELGLDVGARVRSVVFGEDAAWPCEIARPPDRR